MIRRTLIKVCSFLYAHFAKPILFSIPPDKVHEGMTRFTVVVGKAAPLLWITKLNFVGCPNKRLAQNYHGVNFDSPVGLAAGFDKNGEMMPVIAALGFGFGEVGSVTAKPCVGNPRPWFYRLPKTKSAVINAGLGNDGSRAILKRLSKYSQKSLRHFPIILSVAKTNTKSVLSVKDGINDYVTTIKRAKGQKNIQMFEINISCPNTYGGEPFTTPGNLDKLLSAIDKLGVSQPIYVKMPVELAWKQFEDLLKVIAAHQVVGVTISNLFKDRTKVDLKDDLPDSIKGNLSGKPTWEASNELIRQTYLNYSDKLTIIGLGGIFTAQDAYTKIRLGASLIEIVTGMLFNGPQLAAEIREGLSQLLKRDGFDNISQAIGVDAR